VWRRRLSARVVSVVATLAVLFLTSNVYAASCVRPTDPGGSDGYDYGSATVSSFGADEVLVWYTTTGPHAVNPHSSRKDGVPDDVATVASVTNDAVLGYAAQGFRPLISARRLPGQHARRRRHDRARVGALR